MKLYGEQHKNTLISSSNYAVSLVDARRFEEAKTLMRKMIPVAVRVVGEGHRITLVIRDIYAQTSYKDDGAALDDLREAVTMLEDAERIAQRVFGGAHPYVGHIGRSMNKARTALRARETASGTG